jgi:hypothetical protein
MFCVVSTSDAGRDSRLLERDAGLVVRGADAWSVELRDGFREERPEMDRLVLSAIVTNAPLFTAEYDPAQVSLDTGELDPTKTTIEPARWVRFQKAFTGSSATERTVFVVNANHYAAWLAALEAEMQPVAQTTTRFGR